MEMFSSFFSDTNEAAIQADATALKASMLTDNIFLVRDISLGVFAYFASNWFVKKYVLSNIWSAWTFLTRKTSKLSL